jgi:iron-sulfur cluster repair protein YtfE (RIC family)
VIEAGKHRRPQLADDHLEDTVRHVLVEQHARLRELLRALDAKAVAVIRAEPAPGPGLEAALEETVQALTDHIRGEDHAIAMLLPHTPESDRALEQLREEHARQHDELESMRRCCASSDDALSLALAVRALVADVLLDMDLEDRRYLSVAGRISERT